MAALFVYMDILNLILTIPSETYHGLKYSILWRG